MATVLENPTIQQIAAKHNCTTGQVMIGWIMKRGCVPITKSFRTERITENWEGQNVKLDDEDMTTIATL
jgi:diketogulonate reductase-like aldo/keto reductase